jgi:hypothetical protein
MFTTCEVMSSPYNYRWYVPEWAHSLWFFKDWAQDDVFVREGKGASYYYSSDPTWRKATERASHQLTLSPRRERARNRYLARLALANARRTAFVMGSHPRLGALSLIHSLDPHLLQMVVPRPFNV